ncbi:hypothetical protein JTE90_022775 [Oedothorax gibbosus]|uniref:TEP1-F n=1 Tax=Oedothorax gibbosus TaxID=931172 RepID=A0AAV6U9B3_9ARAC|nr:hypothetical protein JTE90_022775 [Oedothorax gibbosus]
MKMKNVALLATTLCALILSCLTEEKNGYIFTSPRSLKIGSENELQLLRFGNVAAGKVTVRLYYSEYYNGNETLASEKEFDLAEGEKETFLKFFVDPFISDSVYNGRIEINGTIGDEKIGGSDKVYFSSPKKNIIVIQTDKPMYKPGQEVKGRVLKLDKNLKPSLNESDVGNVYVEDPKGTRLFEFNKLQLDKGLSEFGFPLSEEPVLGRWRITFEYANETESTNFLVSQYVLPKFEVKIHFPPFVLADAKTIPVKVCANYTYGKPVVGHLNLNLSLEQYSYSYNYDKVAVIQESVELDGCFNYDLNISLVQISSGHNYRRIMVVANVIEAGTGIQINETQFLSRQYSPLTLNFNTDENQRQYFKPGLPYTGKLKVTHPDNSAAADEPVSICYTVSRQRIIANWAANKKVKFCKNYTSDNSGLIEYVIPPQNVDTTSIQLEAKSLTYQKQKGESSVLDQPQTSMSVSPFYSPSGSFIQLENIGSKFACGAKKGVKLMFTSRENADFKFNYEVINKAQVVKSGTKEVSFTTDKDISERYDKDSRIINDSEEQLVPTPKKSKDPADEECTAAKESKYVPPIGETTFEIDVDASLSPTFTLLVFYIRDDKETIADSHKFEVEKCFTNKVDFEFTDEVKQPGEKTGIKVKASPNSLCGIKVVDKSVSLMDGGDQLTKDKIYQLVQSFDSGVYYGTNPCNDRKPQPGLYAASTIIKPPGGYSTSQYQDSFASFQDSGLLVISNLILFTRPCSSEGGYGGSSDYYPESFNKPAYSKDGVGVVAYAAPAMMGAGGSSMGDLAADTAKSSAVSTKSAVEVRKDFPETWLFSLQMAG